MKNRFGRLADELHGYLELGMANEALAIASNILKSEKIDSLHFCEAVDAILIQADHLKPWRGRVERAYERLNETGKRLGAARMLDFYVSISAWEEAYNFIPRKKSEPQTLLFSVWTLLELRNLEEAASVFLICLKQLKTARDKFDKSCLLEAVAAYLAQTGEWEKAESAWEAGQEFPYLAENAWDGLTKLHAYRGLLQANIAFETAKQNSFWDEPALMLPNNSIRRSIAVDRKFHRYASHLAKVIPAKERWRFGM
jgi:hypothetical protein